MPRLGVALRDPLPPAGLAAPLPARALVDLAVLADRLGYDSVWVPEGRGRDAFALLGAMALATRRVRLATGILPVFSRPPALAAMAAATLDDLSGGRLILGIGTGHPAVAEDGYGLPFDRPVRAVREFAEIVRLVLRGQPVRYPGRVFHVEAFTLESPRPRPVPVIIGALGPRMRRLAAQIGDGALLNWTTVAGARAAVEEMRGIAARAGGRSADLEVACFIRTCVADDVERGRAVLRRHIAAYAALPAYARFWAALGFAEDVAGITEAWRRGIDAAAEVVSSQMVDALGLVGPADACRDGIARFRAVGVDLPVIYPLRGDGHDDLGAAIAALAPASSSPSWGFE